MDMNRINSTDEQTRNDLEFEQNYQSKVKKILAKHFKVPVKNISYDEELDLNEATDFKICNIKSKNNKNIKVAVRMRRNHIYLNPNWRFQFTIRYSRPYSGVDTEIHKIRNGLVDYIFYGFLNQDESEIRQCFIGNLKLFREHEPNPCDLKRNNDFRESEFVVYNLYNCPDNFIVFHAGFPEKFFGEPPYRISMWSHLFKKERWGGLI